MEFDNLWEILRTVISPSGILADGIGIVEENESNKLASVSGNHLKDVRVTFSS